MSVASHDALGTATSGEGFSTDSEPPAQHRSPTHSPEQSPMASPSQGSPAPSPRECPAPAAPRQAVVAQARASRVGPRPPPSLPRARVEDGLPLGRSNSICSVSNPARKFQRKNSVQALLAQFSNFAQDLHETHELDFGDLKKELEESESIIKALIDEEVQEREEGDMRLEKRCAALEKAMEAMQKQRDAEGSTKHRMDELENTFAAWADKHTRDVESLRKAHEALGRELSTFNEAHEQHLEVEESLDTAVKGLTSAAEQTAKALAAAKAKLDVMHEGVMSCEQHCQAAEARSAALAERLKDAERRLEGSVGSCSKDLELLRGDHGNLSAQVKQKINDTHDMIHHHLASIKARSDVHENNHSDLVSKHDGQARDIKSLRDDTSKHGQDLGLLRRHVEGALGELAHNTASELKATRDDLDQILSLLSGVQRAWRPCSSRTQGRKKRLSDEASSPKTPKTPYDVSIDLMKHGVEPRTPHTPQLL